MEDKRRLRVLDANILYLIGAILFWTIGAYFQGRDFKSGLMITQYLVILLPPLVYVMADKLSIRETFRLNKISFKHGFLVACITILMYPLAAFGNIFLMTIISLLGNLNVPELPTASSGREYLVFLFIISISAGICEEMFFRGFILSGYERLGRKKAIIFSAILFGVFHFNLYNLVATTILGLVFACLVIETNSIFAGMIGHMVNNGFAVTLGFLLNLGQELVPDIEGASEIAMEIPTRLALVSSALVLGIIGIITSLLAYQLFKIIKKDLAEEGQGHHEYNGGPIGEDNTRVRPVEFIPLILPAALFIITLVIQIREIISLG